MNKKTRGFVLIELIVVLAVMGIISVIAVPKYLKVQEDTKKSRAMVDAKEVYRSAEFYVAQNSKVPTNDELLSSVNARGCIRQLTFASDGSIISTKDQPFVYAEDGYAVQCADGEWTYLEHYLGNSYTMDAIIKTCMAKENCASFVKKTSVNNLKDVDIDMKAMGAESWWVIKSNDKTRVDMYLSTEEINPFVNGRHILIHYDPQTKKYSVEERQIWGQNQIPEGRHNLYGTFDTYDEALALYKNKIGDN